MLVRVIVLCSNGEFLPVSQRISLEEVNYLLRTDKKAKRLCGSALWQWNL